MKGPIKAYVLLAILFIALIFLGHWYFGRQGLVWGFIVSLFIHWLLYRSLDRHLLHRFSGRPLRGRDPWGVETSLKKICEKARIPPPQVRLIDCPSLANSFSLAKQPESSWIVLSETLLNRLEPDELHALLAYEVAQIKRLTTVPMSLASALSETALFPARLFERRSLDAGASGPLMRRNWLNVLLMHLFAPLAWLLRTFLVSEKTYYAGDDMATQWLSDPKVLARTLQKLDAYAKAYQLDVPAGMAHLFMVNPLTGNSWTRYFQAQPPVAHRIRRLVGQYPM